MNNLVIADTDGFAVQENTSASMIVGKMVKFTDGHFICDKTQIMPADTTLVAVGVITVWVRWLNNKPAEHRITQPGQSHPYRDEFPDQDESLWPPGLNDEPSDPWRDTRYLRLMDPKTGADFTFVTDSYGGRRAVGDLKSQIANVRSVQPAALPIVQLTSTMMPTKFGKKPRPDFKIVDWRGMREATPPRDAGKPAGKVAAQANDDMDDEIPF